MIKACTKIELNYFFEFWDWNEFFIPSKIKIIVDVFFQELSTWNSFLKKHVTYLSKTNLGNWGLVMFFFSVIWVEFFKNLFVLASYER